jgi:hypothetical protein
MNAGFDFQRARSKVVEVAVAKWLMGRGWKILPAYDFSGAGDDKAPKLMADGESLVLPDLLGCRAGKSIWFEVKLKTSATLYRKTGTWETGISLRHFRHYQKVRDESGLPVWLVFAHQGENEVSAAPLEALESCLRVYSGNLMGRGGMAFFPYAALRRLATLADVVADELEIPS